MSTANVKLGPIPQTRLATSTAPIGKIWARALIARPAVETLFTLWYRADASRRAVPRIHLLKPRSHRRSLQNLESRFVPD